MKERGTVGRASLADLDGIVEIETACFGDDGEAFSRRRLAYLIAKARGACFVLRREGKVAGYLSLLSRRGSGLLRIYSVAVHPAFRGQGFGRMLVERSLNYASEQGFSGISLEVKVGNRTALALYEKSGFVRIEVLSGYYHDGTDGVRMKRKL